MKSNFSIIYWNTAILTVSVYRSVAPKRDESLQQRLWGPQNLKYLLSGPLQNKVADPCTVSWLAHVSLFLRSQTSESMVVKEQDKTKQNRVHQGNQSGISNRTLPSVQWFVDMSLRSGGVILPC